MAAEVESWGERYYDHFEKFLRGPAERKVFESNDERHSIQILTFERVFEDCRVFASLGLTHYRKEIGQLAEVVLVADEGWPESPAILANALFYLVQSSKRLGRGTAVSGIEYLQPQFAHKFGKTALYFTLPFAFPEDFAEVGNSGGPGFVFLAMFISQAEYDFARERGAEAFEDLLQASNVDPFSIGRRSAV